ncbi:MAG: hypothetical protein OWT27_05945 [Firmicutes bacterium]|nr:hypothetical protein [Bacillota bacterium]
MKRSRLRGPLLLAAVSTAALLVACSAPQAATHRTPQAAAGLTMADFTYARLLPFAAKLPRFTAGKALTYTNVTKYLGSSLGPSISLTATYGLGTGSFTVMEGRPAELRIAQRWTGHFKFGRMSGRIANSPTAWVIGVEQRGVMFDLSTAKKGGIGLPALKRVASSLTLPASGRPQTVDLSWTGADTIHYLDFPAVPANEVAVPGGLRLVTAFASITVAGSERYDTATYVYSGRGAQLDVTQLKVLAARTSPPSGTGVRYVRLDGETVEVMKNPGTYEKGYLLYWKNDKDNVQTYVQGDLSQKTLNAAMESIIRRDHAR